MKKRFSFFALLLAFAMIVAACSSDSDDTTTTTTTEPAADTSVLDLAIEAGQFSTLIAAIDAAGLGETLEGEGPFTILAPTDAAFDAAFEALGITAEELLADTETLTAILLYHVLGQEADSQLVATLDGSSVATLNPQEVAISVVDGQIMINEATVVSADLIADNGIVHVIDAVLLPPDIAEALGVAMTEEAMEEETTTTTEATTTTTEAMAPTIAEIVAEAAAGDPAEFTVLLAALETADLVEALNGEGPFTVFAPTDAAFAALLEELGVTAEELLANPDLANILLYHVVSGEFLAADVIGIAPADVPTLYDENTVAIAVVDGSVVINDVATVVTADVLASNGVVHVIDAVLVPAS
jgi:transforming growth factor-beta-induced protein